ncbi:MAG: hypothetical protein FWC66_05210 [Oscillospiraceae bacterium]|nr:hypothetical protein [Oscillospiraceae bacterium]
MSEETNVTTPSAEDKKKDDAALKTFTQEELTRIAAKEAGKGETRGHAAGLEAGLEAGKAEARAALFAEMGFDEESYAAYLEAKKNKETDSDRLKDALSKIAGLDKKLKAAGDEHAETLQALSAYAARDTLSELGLTDVKKQKLYIPAIKESIVESETFADAAKRFKEENPELFEEDKQKTPPPPEGALYGGRAGGSPPGAMTLEAFKVLSYLDKKKFKDENPEGYAALQKG